MTFDNVNENDDASSDHLYRASAWPAEYASLPVRVCFTQRGPAASGSNPDLDNPIAAS